MIINRLLLLTVVGFSLVGCATTNEHVEHFEHSYYKSVIAKSNNINKIRAFLGENDIKLVGVFIVDNLPNGSFSSVLINGKRLTYVNPTFANFTTQYSNSLVNNELASYYVPAKDIGNHKPLKNGKYFNTVFCVDYTHATLAPNNEKLILPVSYMLTAITKDSAQLNASQVKPWNCDGYEFGDVIYKKSIEVTSTIDSAKVAYELKKGETTLTDADKFSLVVYEALDKAGFERLNDAEMFQAWKDYLVAINGSNNENTVKVSEQIKPVVKQESEEIKGLDDAKNSCKELGFKVGSKEFGNCVLKLAK